MSLNEILYIEGLKDYVKIYTDAAARPILTLTSMKSLEERLPSEQFMRIHRSFIVNMSRVKMVERGQIIFGNKQLPISDSYKDKIMAYIEHRLP